MDIITITGLIAVTCALAALVGWIHSARVAQTHLAQRDEAIAQLAALESVISVRALTRYKNYIQAGL